jgi:small subunit ribosomal protein S6
MIILRTIGTESELAQAVSQLEDPVKRFGGQLDQSASWGRRRLAYKIAKFSEGQYHLMEFRILPAQLAEVKRAYQLNEAIVRFIILNRTGWKPSPPAVKSERPDKYDRPERSERPERYDRSERSSA